MFDFIFLSAIINLNVETSPSSAEEIYLREIKLGTDLSNKVNVNKVNNFSDRILSDGEKNALSFELDFGIQPRT